MKAGNAAFDEWCFNPGCGMVHRGRPKGKSYEVKSFNSVLDSVKSYVRDLNTGRACELPRDIALL